uniref:Uncharacterized protein n=1 Tax=Chenopodium quinoa TaxID=63459 RepID=A0A803KNF5_CHEQI
MACDNPRSCQDSACCSQGKKYQWPELLGKDATEAKKIIESDNPKVTVEIETDFCKKYEWPEVVGEEVNKALDTIQHDRPEVNVVIQTKEFLNDDPKEFCCNRVIIYAKQDVIVNPYPRIG